MTDQLDLDAIRARYQRALDAKPSKGDYTPAGIDAITDSVCDIPDLLRELERLGDQNCRYANRIANNGHMLQALIDQHVTPRAEALAVIHTNAETIAKHYGDQWPHHGGCMDAADSGCPLCRILAASEGTPE